MGIGKRVGRIVPGLAALAIACEFDSTSGTPSGDDDGTATAASTAADDGDTRGPTPTSVGPGDDGDGEGEGEVDGASDGSGDSTTGGECPEPGADPGECARLPGPLSYANPCTASGTDECPWANFCVMANEVVDTTTFPGEPGVVYDVTLRARGVVSQVLIVGGRTDGHFNVGGEPMPTNPFHPVRLDVSDPPARYYFNAGPDQAEYTIAIDGTHTLPIAAGAELRLGHYDTSACSPRNADPGGEPVSLPDIEDPAQPYDGQFFRVDFVSAAPRR